MQKSDGRVNLPNAVWIDLALRWINHRGVASRKREVGKAGRKIPPILTVPVLMAMPDPQDSDIGAIDHIDDDM